MQGRWLVVACAAMLAGCAVPPGNNTAPAGSSAANPVFATQLAGPSTFLAPMPTAIVVLRPDDLNRNRAFCAAITSRLPSAQQALAASVVAPNLVLTRWLVQLPEVPAGRSRDCDFLVGTYDYARAARLLGSVRLTAGQVTGPGPFLLLVVADGSGLHVVGLDGSGYDAASFGAFVDTWAAALRQTEAEVGRAPDQPGLVRSIFDLVFAIFRTAAGAVGGLIEGVVGTL